ncbi:DUF4145 domain-containing protein [Delftia sp. WSY_14]|uniref:DUF4145 domain-containing protein n=1 Tax=unclassified Delftia TaxID=2613839 RepID=UPI003709D215
MDRKLFLKNFTITDLPEWKCPTCAVGHLTLDKENLKFNLTAESREEQQLEWSQAEWRCYRFACIFYCSRCKEIISCAGKGEVDRIDYYDDDGDHQTEYINLFDPSYFYPPLQMMDVPEDCPREVADHLRTSFSMFFANPAAALNSARIAVEALMDHFNVPAKFAINDKRMFLHQRIEKMPDRHANVREHLLAVKWLGNAGSHNGEMPERQDVIDIYDVLEFALHRIFDRTEEIIRLKVERINRDQGLPQKRPASENGL